MNDYPFDRIHLSLEGQLARQNGVEKELLHVIDPAGAFILNNQGITKDGKAAALFIIFCVLLVFIVLGYYGISELNGTLKNLAIIGYALAIAGLLAFGIKTILKKPIVSNI